MRVRINEHFVLDLGEGLYIRGEVKLDGSGSSRKPVLLVCHGFKAFKDWGFIPYVSDYFSERGYYTIHFNFSCNGVNQDDFDELDKFAVNTYSQEQSDLGHLLASLRERKLPHSESADLDRLYLLGHSRGGGNSILFAAEHPEVKAVVSWNGIARANLFDEAFEAEARRNGVAYVQNARTKQAMPINSGFFEDLEEQGDRFDIVAKLQKVKVPVLLIQGQGDSDRLVEGFAIMNDAAPGQTFISLPGANHTFGAVHPFAGTTADLETALSETGRFLETVNLKG